MTPRKVARLINALLERKKIQLKELRKIPDDEIVVEEIRQDDDAFLIPEHLEVEIALLESWVKKPKLILERITAPPNIPLRCPRDISPNSRC
jgi:hypothetical protein